MRIHTNPNGLYVNAISLTADGKDVNGHLYQFTINGLEVSRHGAIEFQNGTYPEVGANGLTNEALLDVLIHRLNVLNGKFPCRENALAITKMEEALMWLNQRTTNREKRGVEGQHVA